MLKIVAMAKILSEKIAYQTPHVKVIDLEISFAKKRSVYQIVQKNDSVMLIPVLENGKLILIKEYSAAANSYLLTFPKGRVETGEKPEITIVRELQEEAGYKPGKIKLLTSLLVSPGYLRQKTYIYLCTNLTKSRLQGDVGEQPEVKTFTFKEVDDLIKQGKIQEARIIAAFYLARNIYSK